jgi:hypothetical protein
MKKIMDNPVGFLVRPGMIVTIVRKGFRTALPVDRFADRRERGRAESCQLMHEIERKGLRDIDILDIF